MSESGCSSINKNITNSGGGGGGLRLGISSAQLYIMFIEDVIDTKRLLQYLQYHLLTLIVCKGMYIIQLYLRLKDTL